MRRTPRVLFAVACVRHARFVPPWEREGKSADDFFRGLLQHQNPIQQQRKQRQRAVEAEAMQLESEPFAPEELRREEEAQRHQKELAQKQREFLPYGCTPRQYFDTSKMAAWGEYQRQLRLSGPGEESPGEYSDVVMQLLEKDMEEKIPYKYEACPAQTTGACEWPLHGSAGLVLDIDGVIYRSKKIIPGSDVAVQMLQKLKIPFVFMTNGGGVTEAAKARELSDLLHCDIDPRQVILSHSPMRLLSRRYQHTPVLIGGGSEGEAVARSYGFEQPISIERFQCEHPELTPFKNWTGLRKAEPHRIPYPSIGAVLTFSDLLDVMSDVQVVLDILLSPYGKIGNCVSGVQAVPYYHCADDLLWATEAPLPRLGGGAIREMLTSAFQSVSGQNLQVVMYGKPRAIAYAFAERQLKMMSENLGWDPANLQSIFMVGDNIESDIMGANAAHGLWTSVHVLSGIGAAPAAQRTLIEGDEEQLWLERCVSKVPHYVAPTLDHFLREVLSYPQAAILSMKTPYYGEPNPVDLQENYHFI